MHHSSTTKPVSFNGTGSVQSDLKKEKLTNVVMDPVEPVEQRHVSKRQKVKLRNKEYSTLPPAILAVKLNQAKTSDQIIGALSQEKNNHLTVDPNRSGGHPRKYTIHPLKNPDPI
jgi:hypothetical protein